jgi:prepilin-type processing-associated H-X9-DG protein
VTHGIWQAPSPTLPWNTGGGRIGLRRKRRAPALQIRGSTSYSRRRAYTSLELLAILGIGVILLAIFVPFSASLIEGNRRVRCEDNLLQLRDALQAYANVNHNDFPRTLYDPVVNRDGYTAFTGADAANPFSVSVGPSDVTASLWLLVRGGYVTNLSIFVCPSSREYPDRLTDPIGRPVAADRRSNFRSAANLSYSYADPFSGYVDYRLNSDVLPAHFALLADKNPGSAAAKVGHDAAPLDLARGNSLNHGQAGQNVLFADGSVTFQTTPYCGVGVDADKKTDGDNIYTVLAPLPLTPGNSPFYANDGFTGRRVGPSYQYDSYLVPTEEDGR